jgi:FAD/FMN-containing dehydrogenase
MCVLKDVTDYTAGSMRRRAFLGIAAAGAATSAAAVAFPSAARAASGDAQAPALLLARSAGPAPADWTALARDLAGTLVRPGEAAYATAKLLFDPRFDGQRPAGIAYVKSAHDVSTCLAFVRKFALPFAARCGGHSYAGWSGSSGLIIDVSDLKTVTVSGTTATVGGGTRLIDFYHGLAAHGRAVPGGSCATVGIAGLTLGGGVGVTARAYGLTCDNLEAVQIVTANGAVINATADPRHNGDLFWACQGGGGGNFGVVTQFTFRTVPAPEPVLFSLSWPWSQAGRVIAAWQSWAPTAPDAMWSNMHLAAAPGGRVPTVSVGGCYLGSVGDAANLLDNLYARVGTNPATHFLSFQQPFLTAMLAEAGCSTYTGCHLPWYMSGGTLGREPQFAKSDYFTRPLSSAGISTLLAGVASLQSVAGARGGVGGIAFDAMGGAVNRVAPGATAFVHRNALFGAQYTTDWANGASSTGISNQHAWLRRFWTSMRPYASGQAYVNYIDPDLTNWQTAYYGGNFPRLAGIKKKYDPTRLFTFPQAI